MNLALALCVVVGFAATLEVLDLPAHAREVGERGKPALEVFRDDVEATERAHGDGLKVSSRSPKAFEEMVWKQFWTEHYRQDHIRPWTPDNQSAESGYRTVFIASR
jgi:hypothetical protein